MTILLIEDEESIGGIVRLMLSRRGYNTLWARSLEEGKQIWGAYSDIIDLVITDNWLPNGNGVALAEEFRQRKRGLRIILASGSDQAGLPDGFITLNRPLDTEVLLDAVRNVLEEHKGPEAVTFRE